MTTEQHNTLTPYLPKWLAYQRDKTLKVEAHEMEVIHGVFIEMNPGHPYRHKKAISCSNCRLAIFKDVFREYDKYQPVNRKLRTKTDGKRKNAV